MRIKVLMMSAVLVCAAFNAAAAAPYPQPDWNPYAQRAGAGEAGEIVRRGMEGLLAFLSAKPAPSGLKLAAFLEQQLAAHFDFDYMAKASLGPAYRRMTAEQRADLTQKIEQDFLQTLSGGLAGYSNQKVKFFRPRQGSGQRASVTVGIANPGGYPSRLDFRLYHGAEGWKVYDVAANGNSAVNYYRQRFARNWSQSMPYPGRI